MALAVAAATAVSPGDPNICVGPSATKNRGALVLKRSTLILFAMLAPLILRSELSFAQSFEQSASYILSAGRLELDDIKVIDKDIVSSNVSTGSFEKYGKYVKVIDRGQCTVSTFFSLDNQSDSTTYYLSNVIMDELKHLRQQHCCIMGQPIELHTIVFNGEQKLICRANNQCDRHFSIQIGPGRVERVLNAIKYVYSNYCKSAKRKSAF